MLAGPVSWAGLIGRSEIGIRVNEHLFCRKVMSDFMGDPGYPCMCLLYTYEVGVVQLVGSGCCVLLFLLLMGCFVLCRSVCTYGLFVIFQIQGQMKDVMTDHLENFNTSQSGNLFDNKIQENVSFFCHFPFTNTSI